MTLRLITRNYEMNMIRLDDLWAKKKQCDNSMHKHIPTDKLYLFVYPDDLVRIVYLDGKTVYVVCDILDDV